MTAKEIAAALGVSPATVSMVINNRPGISESRRMEILAKMEELNFKPAAKRNAPKQRSVGFVVFKKSGIILGDSPFFMLLLDTLTNQLSECQFSLQMLYFSCEEPIKYQLRQIENSGCDGLMIFATEAMYEDLPIFKAIKKPYVIIDNTFDGDDFDTVCIHNENGIRKSMSYLLSLGHTQIGYLRSKQIINSFSERFSVYRRVMHENGLEINPRHVLALSYSHVEFSQDMEEYLSKPGFSLPTAYIADNDIIAINAIKVFQAHGINVPGDVSIIGFDDRPICNLSEPKLTTIAVPVDSLAKSAIYLLTNRLNGAHTTAIKISVGVSLVCRDSVSAP